MSAVTDQVTPQWLLDQARAIIGGGDGELTGRWSRASALLARQALELQLERLCLARDPGFAECTGARARLLCLPTFADPAVATEAAATWAALSRACHFQGYELAPTAEELEGWLDSVGRLVALGRG